MPQLVTMGAILKCSFGVAPSTLAILPLSMVNAGKKPVATIKDFAPVVNIMPFGMCMTPSNPQVAAATAAAQGVLTPMPCIPVITAPWIPGSPTILVGKVPALNSASTCMCAWGGLITITIPGQVTVNVM